MAQLPRGKQQWVFQYYREVYPVDRTAKRAPKSAQAPPVGLFFLDSGAHSLYNREVMAKKKTIARVGKGEYDYYDTPAFWEYVDAYAAFVKKHRDVIDYYANVDVIYHPAKTWEVQQYLEKEHGLRPVPVVHYACPLEWVDKYLATGHDFIGVGGLGQGATKDTYLGWADKLFAHLCPAPKRLPVVRTHGFAMTSYELLLRYPWWSVDSATWTKVGAFGGILVPHKRGGKFTFEEAPYQMTVSIDSPEAGKPGGKHYFVLSKAERQIICEWLEEIDVPLGGKTYDLVPGKGGKKVKEYHEPGVINRHSERKIANLLFFEKLRQWLPEYPWPFKHAAARPAGFGLSKR